MIDFQGVADNVRSILHWADSANVDAVADAAEAYFAACEEVNQRLLRCSGLLRKGLRSEAIHLAESEPNLLDAVALLDLPEMEEWRALLKKNGLEVADPLLYDVAAQLNEAYAAEEPLTNLLRRYRLQALARSSLRDRIHTLSEIRRLDGHNPLRDDDLRAHEKLRHEEIRSEASGAYDHHDLNALEALKVELQKADWLEAPPKPLVQKVSSQFRSTQKKVARSELEALIEPLERAHAEWDATAGRAARADWTRWVKIARLPEDDPLLDRAAPALEWLTNEDNRAQTDVEFNNAVAALEAALDDDSTTATDLERCGYEVFRHERSIPDVLARRYRERTASLELSSTRRTRLIVAAAGVVGVCLILLVGWTIYGRIRDQRIADAKTSLEALIEGDRIDEAAGFLASLEKEHKGLYDSGSIQEIAVQVRGLIDAEEQRLADFRKYMDQATADGAEQPDLNALRKATELAKSDDEHTQVAKFQAAVSEIRLARQQKHDAQFQTKLEVLLDKQQKLQQLQRTDFLAAKLPIRALHGELLALLTSDKDISDTVRGRADTLNTWLSAREAEYNRIEDESRYLTRIDKSVGNLEEFGNQLKAYAERFKNTPRSDDFGRVLGTKPLWEGTLTWNEFAKRWRDAAVLNSMPDDAAAYVEQATAQIEQFKSYPQAVILNNQLPELKSLAARRDSSGELITSSLSALLSHPTMANLSMAIRDDRRYYFSEKIEPGVESVSAKYFVDFDMTKSKATPNFDVGDKQTTFLGEAPQSRLVREASNDLIAMRPIEWEEVFAKHIVQVGTDDMVDPIPQLILLKALVETGRQGSSILEKRLAQLAALLQSAQLDLTVNWLKPRDDDAERVRSLASNVVKGLPDLHELQQQIVQDHTQLIEATVPSYQWVGWLDQDFHGQWHVRALDTDQEEGELFVVSPGSGDKLEYATVGRLAEGAAHVDQTAGRHLLRGKPIFVSGGE